MYSTTNPKFATIGAVCIMAFTTLAFLLYDALVRTVVRDKQAILDAKRQVRYMCDIAVNSTSFCGAKREGSSNILFSSLLLFSLL